MEPPHSPSLWCSRPNPVAGFTVFELLVVITLLSILMLLVSQSVGRSRESARALQSLRQLQTIGWALDQFRYDNRNNYPAVKSYTKTGAETAWTRHPLDPYLPMRKGDLANLVFICPNANYTDYVGYPDKTKLTRTFAATAAMIGLNAATTATTELTGQRSFFSIGSPAKTVLVVDGRQSGTSAWSASYIYWTQIDMDIQAKNAEACRFIDFRHNGTTHLLFCDGHIESATPATLPELVNFANWTGIGN